MSSNATARRSSTQKVRGGVNFKLLLDATAMTTPRLRRAGVRRLAIGADFVITARRHRGAETQRTAVYVSLVDESRDPLLDAGVVEA